MLCHARSRAVRQLADAARTSGAEPARERRTWEWSIHLTRAAAGSRGEPGLAMSLRSVTLISFALLLGFSGVCVAQPPQEPAAEPAVVDGLFGCISYALAESPRLKAAQERLVQAGARIDQAKAEAGPTVSATAGLRIQAPTVKITLPSGQSITVVQLLTGQLGLSATLPIDTSGRIGAGKRMAAFAAQAALEDLRATAQQLILDVTTAYYGVLNARSAERVGEATVRSLTERLRVATVQEEAGLARSLDALEVADQLQSARDRLAIARARETAALASLNALLSRPAVDAPLPSAALPRRFGPGSARGIRQLADSPATGAAVGITAPEIADWEIPTPEASLERAEEAKPELAALGERLKQAGAGVAYARSGRKPSLKLDFGALLQNPTGLVPALGAQISAGIFQPIFDRGKVRAAIREAESLERELSAQYAEARNGLAIQVADALVAAQDAELSRKTARQVLATAERAASAARASQAQGLLTRADVLEAERRLEVARESAITSDYAAVLARVQWARAVGVLDLPFFESILSAHVPAVQAAGLSAEGTSSP